MPATVSMTNRQHVAAVLVLTDADGQPIEGLPAGATATWESDDPLIATATPDASMIRAEVNSGLVGTARIVGTVTLAGGLMLSDFLDVTITSSEPASVVMQVGTPVDE